MRHRKNNVGLNRTAAHRKALLMNLTNALVTHKKIVTTLPKAKATRKFAEKMITFARRGDIAARRMVFAKLRQRDIVKELFTEIAPKYRDRNGGYTRIIKLDNRAGDNAPMAILELVGYAADEPGKKAKKTVKKKAAPKKEEAPKVKEKAEEKVEAVEEAPVEEAKAEEVVETPVEEKPAEEAAPEAAEEAKEEEKVEAAPAEEEAPAEEPKDEAKDDKEEKKD